MANLGATYDDLDSPYRAEACFRAAIDMAQRYADTGGGNAVSGAHERLARILVSRGKNVLARSELEQVKSCPDAMQGDRFLLTEALLLSLERKLREAIGRLGEVLQHDPRSGQHPEALFTLASLQHELREDPAAIATLEELERAYPATRFASAGRRLVEHIRQGSSGHQH
jgi:tetratricopeptide (TPR) repeat protein